MITYTRDEPLLTLSHVSKIIGSHVILHDLNAQITNITRADKTQGQIVCILGPSGIGKTRLARIVAGLDQPTSGAVMIEGKPTFKGLVGLVPQNYPLFEFTSVQNNFLIAGRYGGLSVTKAKVKAQELSEELGLTHYLQMYPCQLSGGTRQRVAIVRQLMCSKHFIVMDEPFSGLDPIMKRQACKVITQIAERDTLNTVIINTHDVTEGMAIADTVWLLGPEVPGVQGANIVEQWDMAARGLCWREDIVTDPEFQKLVGEVKQRFQTLV